MTSGKRLAETLIKAHLLQLKTLIEKRGVRGLDRLYRDAIADLQRQLLATGAPSSNKATAVQLRAMIGQAEAALEALGQGLQGHLADVSKAAVDLGARHAVKEHKVLAKVFRGTTPVLNLDNAAVFRGMVDGVERSLLRRHSLAARTWTVSAVQRMENRLGIGMMAGRSTFDLTNELMGEQGLLEEERYRAERIVRTECAYSSGAAKQQAMMADSESQGRKLHKRIIETFDDRTGDDSQTVHGQTVPVDRPFNWKRKAGGKWLTADYMHPPNRPGDRATVIPWDPAWDEVEEDRPLTNAELRAAPPTRYRKHVGVEVPPGRVPGKRFR